MLLLKCSESLHEPDGQVHVPMIQTVTKQVEVPQIQYEDEVVEVPIQKQARGLGAWLAGWLAVSRHFPLPATRQLARTSMNE